MANNNERDIPISVFVITQDEEVYIGKLLDSVKRFDEVIVVDSGQYR